MTEDALLAKMRALKGRVAGVTDIVLASRDGLIITSDTARADADNIAALAAASLGVAQRMTAETGQGTLRQAIAVSTGGCVAIYAVGVSGLLVVVGDDSLDSDRLHAQSRETIEAIERLLIRAQLGTTGGAAHAAG